jgi:hypothetical protein
MNALLALMFGPFLQSKGLMKVEGDRPEFMPAAAHVQSMEKAEEPRCRAGTRARDQLWFTRTVAGTICLGNSRKHAREGATLTTTSC